MVKQHIPMASDHTKHSPNLSTLKSLSKKPPTHRSHTLTFPDAHRQTSAKVVEHAASRESSGSTTQRKNPFEVGPCPSSGRNAGDEILGVYPFVEEPVRFNFGDDYGNRLFLDLQREILSRGRDMNYGRARQTLGAVKKAERSSRHVYALSSEADMISSFLRDGLF